jgi:hypothetical protein
MTSRLVSANASLAATKVKLPQSDKVKVKSPQSDQVKVKSPQSDEVKETSPQSNEIHRKVTRSRSSHRLNVAKMMLKSSSLICSPFIL